MGELENLYQSVEVLKALKLPISIEQLERIDRLEKENGVKNRDDLKTYFYEQCFALYSNNIINIRQAKIRGEVIVAKPVLLLALIDGITENVFSNNKFELTDWLEERYTILMRKYTRSSQFSKVTGIENPFWHLKTDGFGTLQFRQAPKHETSPSRHWLKNNVEYAYFDEPLWIMLQNETWRMRLRDFIIDHKLTNDSWNGKMAAERLGFLIAALLLAA